MSKNVSVKAKGVKKERGPFDLAVPTLSKKRLVPPPPPPRIRTPPRSPAAEPQASPPLSRSVDLDRLCPCRTMPDPLDSSRDLFLAGSASASTRPMSPAAPLNHVNHDRDVTIIRSDGGSIGLRFSQSRHPTSDTAPSVLLSSTMNAAKESKRSDIATYYTISRMVKDGAAALSGQVHLGDRVIAIAGQRVESLSVEEAKRLIKG